MRHALSLQGGPAFRRHKVRSVRMWVIFWLIWTGSAQADILLIENTHEGIDEGADGVPRVSIVNGGTFTPCQELANAPGVYNCGVTNEPTGGYGNVLDPAFGDEFDVVHNTNADTIIGLVHSDSDLEA